jgi:hypothetical protein
MVLIAFIYCVSKVRIGKAPIERAPNPARKSVLELALRLYAERREGVVVDPAVGTSFDLLEEAYEFYNLYFWETGFAVRFAKEQTKCAADKVYARYCVWMRSNELFLLDEFFYNAYLHFSSPSNIFPCYSKNRHTIERE